MDYIFKFNSISAPKKLLMSRVLLNNETTELHLVHQVSSKREKQQLAHGPACSQPSLPWNTSIPTGISGWRQHKDKQKNVMPFWVLVHIHKCACVTIKMQNLHGCSNVPAPLNRPAGLVWQHVQYEQQDDTSSLGYI